MFDSKNKRLIVETIFDDPDRSFYLRELAEEAGVSPSTVSRILDGLEEGGLVDVDDEGVRMRIESSKTDRFRDIKRSYNLYRLAETGLIDEIEDKTFPEAIVLFGSYAKGEDSKESDIDIAVVDGREIDEGLERYEKELGRVLNLHNVDREDSDQNFIETLANGEVLRGYLEL